MTELKTFIIRGEHREALSLLSQEQKGDLLDAMFSYNLDGEEVELEGMVKMAFAFIKNSFDSDRRKYEATCERNRNNGKKSSGRPRKEGGGDPGDENPDGISETQGNPKNPVGLMETQDNPAGGEKSEIDDKNGNPNGKEDNPENPVGLSETQGNPEEPKKPYSYTNSYTNTNSNIIPPISPRGEVNEELSASDLIKVTQLHWNSLPRLPQCKRTMASFSEPGKMATIIRDLGVEEVKGAMDRLASAWETQESRYRPKSYQRFILGNLEYWANFESEGKTETKSACAPEAPPEISDEERAEVQKMMEEEGGILGIIAKNRERIHETA